MPDLVSIAPKLARLLRMLTSEHDGEVVDAARAIKRTLEGEKLDMHSLADTIESANGIKKFSEADAAKIYRQGVHQGRDDAEAERGFRSVTRGAKILVVGPSGGTKRTCRN